MERSIGLRICVLVLLAGGVAAPAAAQDGPNANISVGYIFREGSVNKPHAWIAAVSLPVGRLISIEISGFGARSSEPDVDIPVAEFFSRAYEVLAGVKVTPIGHGPARPFGHILVGPRFQTIGERLIAGGAEDSNKLKEIVITPGAGIDLGGRHVAFRLQYDRPTIKLYKSSLPIHSDGFSGYNRFSMSLVIGF